MGAQVSEQDLDDWPTRKRGISWPIVILFLRPCARERDEEREKIRKLINYYCLFSIFSLSLHSLSLEQEVG